MLSEETFMRHVPSSVQVNIENELFWPAQAAALMEDWSVAWEASFDLMPCHISMLARHRATPAQ